MHRGGRRRREHAQAAALSCEDPSPEARRDSLARRWRIRFGVRHPADEQRRGRLMAGRTGHAPTADGRRLTYCDNGDPAATRVIGHHGTPGSRLDRHPDRPGYGESDPQRTRRAGAAGALCVSGRAAPQRTFRVDPRRRPRALRSLAGHPGVARRPLGPGTAATTLGARHPSRRIIAPRASTSRPRSASWRRSAASSGPSRSSGSSAKPSLA